jgi:hypothetical protein
MVNKIINMLNAEDLEMRNLGLTLANKITLEDDLTVLYNFLKQIPEKEGEMADLFVDTETKLFQARKKS